MNDSAKARRKRRRQRKRLAVKGVQQGISYGRAKQLAAIAQSSPGARLADGSIVCIAHLETPNESEFVRACIEQLAESQGSE